MHSLLEIESILGPMYKTNTFLLYYPFVYGDMSSCEIEKLKKKLTGVVEYYKKKPNNLKM